MRFNDCFLGKTSLAKSLQMFLGGMAGGTKCCYKTFVPQVKTKQQSHMGNTASQVSKICPR